MKNLSEIIEAIRLLKNLSKDGDVADLLDIKPKTLASAKVRNSIPYKELTLFCSQEGLSLNWLLTGQGPKYLQGGQVVSTEAGALNGLSTLERVYVDRLLEIFRTKDQGTVSAITQNIDTFLRVPSKQEAPPFSPGDEDAGNKASEG